MEIDVNFEMNTAIIYFDDGFKLILTYSEFEELRKLLNEVSND